MRRQPERVVEPNGGQVNQYFFCPTWMIPLLDYNQGESGSIFDRFFPFKGPGATLGSERGRLW
jgi:hypothetical protein